MYCNYSGLQQEQGATCDVLELLFSCLDFPKTPPKRSSPDLSGSRCFSQLRLIAGTAFCSLHMKGPDRD